MNARFRIVLTVLLLGVSGGITWQVLRQSEPVCQGRPASAWLEEYACYAGSWGGSHFGLSRELVEQWYIEGQHAAAVIRQMGTNVVPILLRMAAARDSALKERLFYWEPQNSMLLALKSFLPLRPTAHEQRRMALHSFQLLGPAAKGAVPALIGLLSSKDNRVAANAATILSFIGPEAGQAVPALIEAAKSSDTELRLRAAEALSAIGPSAERAVDVLIELLNDAHPNVSSCALRALGCIRARPEVVVPLLEAALVKHPDVAIGGLGKFGAAAQSAAPSIMPFLNHSLDYVRRDATNALRQIGVNIVTVASVKPNGTHNLSPKTKDRAAQPPCTGR